MAKENNVNVIGMIELPDGTKKEVIGRKGKYILCRDCQFLKSRFRVLPVPKEEKKEKKEKPKEERSEAE